MTDKEKVLDIIKKLTLKANDASVTPEESAAFAAKANELLLKHKLELSDLDLAGQDKDDPVGKEYFDPSSTMRWVGKGRRVAWLESLVSGIARAHFCRILVISGSKTVAVVGRPSDVAIVKYLTHVLAREAERLAVLYERQVRVAAERAGLPTPSAPKRGFLLGFVNAVLERLRAMRRTVEQQGGKHALVRFQEAELAVTKWMDAQKFGKAGGFGSSASTGNKHAFEAGRKAGQNVNLNTGLGGGSSAKQGTLSKGQNLLGGGTK